MKRSGILWLAGLSVVGVVGILVAVKIWPIYDCYTVPDKVTNEAFSVNLFYLERYHESVGLQLDADEIEEWREAFESIPLVADATYRLLGINSGVWRVRFQPYESCLDSGDVLESVHELSADGTVQVSCKTNFNNSRMIPFGCRK